MFASYFMDVENLGGSSNFVASNIGLEMALDENDALEYVEGKVPEPPKNAHVASKSKYKKGEIKTKKIIIYSLKDHLPTYIGKLEESKDIYNKLVGMYEVNNLNHILSLKKQIKDINMNKGEIVQSYFMRLSQLRDQLLIVGKSIYDTWCSFLFKVFLQYGRHSLKLLAKIMSFQILMSWLENVLKKKPRLFLEG